MVFLLRSCLDRAEASGGKAGALRLLLGIAHTAAVPVPAPREGTLVSSQLLSNGVGSGSWAVKMSCRPRLHFVSQLS